MLHLSMAAGLLGGLALGLIARTTGSPFLMDVATGVAPLGTIFVNAIRMVVIPLVVVILFVGVSRLGDAKKLGRVGGTALGFFWLTTLPAILLGMGLMHLALPFAPDVAPPAAAAAVAAVPPDLPGLTDFLVELIPANPFDAAARGDLLAIIVFTVLFAAAASRLPEESRSRLTTLAEDLSAALGQLVHWILWTAPLGILGLVAPITAETGWAMIQNLAVFVVTVLVGLAIFTAAVYLPAVRLLGRMSPLRFARVGSPAVLVAFTTTSSIPALPVMLEAADDLRLSPPVASLVLPLGAALNRAGSALYQGAAVVFLASIYQVEVPEGAWLGAVLATFFAALSVAPVPSASVMTMAPALQAVGAPLDGLGILLGVDRIPDMFRSAVNNAGHMVGAVVVEGTAGPGEAGTERTGVTGPEEGGLR